MKITTNFRPLTGERAVAVAPPLVPYGERRWHRRLNFYTGRALTDVALQTEQEGRAGRLALSGQRLSPGVVAGLEAGLEERTTTTTAEDGSTTTTTAFWVHITAGRAITASGEDVALARNLALRLDQLPLVVTPALKARLNVAELKTEGNSLALVRDRLPLPAAAVLVLQPVTAEAIGNFNPADPCEIDPTSDAFNDKQTIDGCVPLLYLWPDDWRVPPVPGTTSLATWRNRLAYTIFNAELALGPDDALPWELAGAPLALLGFNDNWLVPEFIDRYSVVRAGGQPKRRSLLVANSGNPFLWQARMQQFAEQITELVAANALVEDLQAAFAALPPFGLLPKYAVPLALRKLSAPPAAAINGFFPASFAVEAVPIPVEELDALVPGTASLLPIDMSAATRVDDATETVRLLVPVPLKVYDPDLLIEEEIDAEFAAEVDRLSTVRGQWLQRRLIVRVKAFALYLALTGSPLLFPAPDPEALEADEAVGSDPLNPAEEAFGVSGIGTNNDPIKLDALLAFKEKYMGANAPAFAKFECESFGLDKLAQPLGNLFGSRTTDFPTITIKQGLEDFIDLLERKVKYVEDRIDVSFTRTQTDIYRVRQIVLGTAAATKLATSPALAAIAQGQTAIATREEIDKYVEQSKTKIDFITPPTQRQGINVVGAVKTQTVAGLQQVVETAAHTLDAASAEPTLADRAARLAATETRAELGAGVAGDFGGLVSGASKSIGTTGIATTVGLSNTSMASVTAAVAVPLKQNAAIVDGARLAGNLAAAVTPKDISEQSSIVGKPLDFRTLTISDRITQPPAPEAKDYSVSNKYEVLNSLLNPPDGMPPMYLDDIIIPGFYDYGNDGKVRGRQITYTAFEKSDAAPKATLRQRVVPNEIRISIKDLRDPAKPHYSLDKILAGLHDLDPDDGDEGAFFSASVRAVDHTAAILRLVEGRVKSYKTFIAACQELLTKLRALLDAANARLQVIANELAEARHDVSVARALMAEEQKRIDAINERRTEILREQVSFLAFCRVRAAQTIAITPSRPVDSGLREPPVPDCLHHAVNIPPELRRMVDFLRETPVRWLLHVHPLLDRLDDLNSLAVTLQSAQARAQVQFPLKQASFTPTPGFYAPAFTRVFAAQQQVVTNARAQAVQFNLTAQATTSWQQLRAQTADLIATADLIEAAHGRSDVARLSALELDQIAHVAGCLYDGFGDIPAKMRLLWAEQLSAFDAPVNLRNLASLTRWSGRWHDETNPQLLEALDNQERLARRDLQALVDFLYSRVDPNFADAVGIINDLVRVAILLASHAPVNGIIAGRLPRRATVIKNTLLEVIADPVKVKIGMEALIYSKENRLLARGVVEDLAAGAVATRIVHTTQASLTLETDTRVQFTARKLLA